VTIAIVLIVSEPTSISFCKISAFLPSKIAMNPAVAFTLILLSLMIGSGVVSASWGFTLGRQALTGVRQPEARPSSGAPVSREPAAKGQGTIVLLNEKEILQDVQARINGGG
jgi:hypothetical protein